VILADVNVLVYAFRLEASRHQVYAEWLTNIANGADELALHSIPLAGFLRIVTNARIFERPSPTPLALDFVQRLVAAPRSRWIAAPDATWAHFDALARNDPAISGNLVPDALMAALALAHGCRLATADRGFARYPGLAWFDPAAI
jgi:toxin-antitoxin system PIN domain toxin